MIALWIAYTVMISVLLSARCSRTIRGPGNGPVHSTPPTGNQFHPSTCTKVVVDRRGPTCYVLTKNFVTRSWPWAEIR